MNRYWFYIGAALVNAGLAATFLFMEDWWAPLPSLGATAWMLVEAMQIRRCTAPRIISIDNEKDQRQERSEDGN